MIHDLSKDFSVLSHFLAEIRDVEVQNDRMRFRRNLERVGELLAFEISKTFAFSEQEVKTPLGTAKVNLSTDQVVLATILRAGLPLHQGMLNYLDKSENAFVSAYRKYTGPDEFEVYVEYMASASIDDKILIIADPMLATGTSVELVYKALLGKGKPKRTVVASVIASKDGLDHCRRILPSDTDFYIAAIDEELTAKSYIVPGLGDAGDLAYGKKE